MILASGSPVLTGGAPFWVALAAIATYAVAALRKGAWALTLAWLLHLASLVLDISGWGATEPGARLGFAPVLSVTVWLVIAVHVVESRFVPLPHVQRWLACAGVVVVVLALGFPGDPRQFGSAVAPWHFALGVAAYGLFGAAVVHATLLDAAERRLRTHERGAEPPSGGMPLLQLERLTFRFVEVGFAVLSAALLLGVLSGAPWRWNHKTILSLMGWAVFAALLTGRHLRGWRGRQATRWLYVGAVLLLLSYVGYRFVLEVVLGRGAS